MKTWKKAVIGVVVAGVLIGIVVFSVNQANKGVVTVQTAKVATSGRFGFARDGFRRDQTHHLYKRDGPGIRPNH